MPQFLCPKCGKQYLVPLAICESFLGNMLWRASERSIRDCVKNAMEIAEKNGFQSIAFPIIGVGTGGFDQEKAKDIMLEEFRTLDSPLEVTVVVFKR